MISLDSAVCTQLFAGSKGAMEQTFEARDGGFMITDQFTIRTRKHPPS